MKNLYFKVKKMERDGKEYIGVVAPYFEERGFDLSTLYISENKLEFVTLNGEILEVRSDTDFKTTRITNAKVKEKIDKMILNLKDIYKDKMRVITLNEERLSIDKNLRQKNSKTKEVLEEIVKEQGFMSKKEFIEKMKSIVNMSYCIDYGISNGRLTKIELTKEYELGKWINNNDYTFLYVEYDGNICVNDNYEENKELQKIKKERFKELTATKLCGYPVKEDFYPQGGGDKRSASVYQDIIIDLGKGIELKSENMNKIIDIFRELIKNLK